MYTDEPDTNQRIMQCKISFKCCNKISFNCFHIFKKGQLIEIMLPKHQGSLTAFPLFVGASCGLYWLRHGRFHVGAVHCSGQGSERFFLDGGFILDPISIVIHWFSLNLHPIAAYSWNTRAHIRHNATSGIGQATAPVHDIQRCHRSI